MTASPAAAACAAVVFFEERIYMGNHEPGLRAGRPIGEGSKPDGCNDTVEVVDGVTVESPPIPLRVVTLRRVVGKPPSVAVAVEGDPDTVYIYERNVPIPYAADIPMDGGFDRAAAFGIASALLLAGAFAIWRSAARVKTKPS